MKIEKMIIKNFKLFRDVTIDMNEDVNIFVGDNDSGKTTILEALTIVLTGKVNRRGVYNMLNLDWFNIDVRNDFKLEIEENDTPTLPKIEIEVYFSTNEEDELVIKSFRGANNSLRQDTEGVKLEIIFDDQYSEAYKQQLTDKKIRDIPIEYYKFVFRSFSNPEHYLPTLSKKVAFIDTTRRDYGSVLSRFVASSINEYLSEEDMTNLRQAYRANRHDFIENQAVKTLNQKLQSSHSFGSKIISLNLRENEIDEWKNDMSISLNDIPFENSGFGTQNMFKSEIFILQNNSVDILIIEEPENNLSYSNMSVLISKLSENSGKQLFISTHSSFVANKLGLQHIHLVADQKTVSLSSLSTETYNYFLKLPGYNTLRVLLSNQAILVEGPADELIVQRAYIDYYGKQPIEDGIDVITVGSLAFQRYCELAMLINKPITIVTDNDYNVDIVKRRFEKYGSLVTLCIETNNNLNTLELSLFEVNEDEFEEFRSIVYQGSDIKQRSAESIVEFMIKNKTEWSMRVFMNDKEINYPQYILESIGKGNVDAGEG